MDIGGWVTHPQCCKVLLQGHVALESHRIEGLPALLISSTQDYKFSEKATESCVFMEISKQ